MTDHEIIERGLAAEAVLRDAAFNGLFTTIEASIAAEIMATSLSDTVAREEAFATYHGMKAFVQRLQGFILAKENIKRAQDEQFGEEFDADS